MQSRKPTVRISFSKYAYTTVMESRQPMYSAQKL